MFEKLLEVLAALVAAINNNTAALKGAAAPAAAGESEKQKAARLKAEQAAAAAASGTPTVAEVRDAATKYLAAQKDKPAREKFVSELNAKYGTSRLTEAPAEKFAEIIAALKGEIERLKTAPAGDGDAGI